MGLLFGHFELDHDAWLNFESFLISKAFNGFHRILVDQFWWESLALPFSLPYQWWDYNTEYDYYKKIIQKLEEWLRPQQENKLIWSISALLYESVQLLISGSYKNQWKIKYMHLFVLDIEFSGNWIEIDFIDFWYCHRWLIDKGIKGRKKYKREAFLCLTLWWR